MGEGAAGYFGRIRNKSLGEGMKKTRIVDLNNWPPETGGSMGRGDLLYVGTNEAIVTRFYGTKGSTVTFGCTFGGKEHSYDFIADNEDIAEKVGDVIKSNLGRSLAEIGMVEIEL